jgi:hypothetical protein
VSWKDVVDTMLAELRTGDPRNAAYWAQQLAFGPVLVHAVRLHLRSTPLSAAERTALGEAVALAHSALAALPEQPGLAPARLHVLARRQATALSWGRRRSLTRLLATLGAAEAGSTVVPSRMTRAYPLIGWRPDEKMTG